ncbi:MAG: PQQ-binding-like beta-propeller repeat protein, partial [Candidatus Lokiarchaeota archaeon]|nr:PQQ-binding-like beta-propeller repeat protein [Candidatus Lokiarchaeota archaeon]
MNGSDGTEIWNYTTGGEIFSSPSIGDVNGDEKLDIIVGSLDGKVYALFGEDGTEIWNYNIGNLLYSSPSLGDLDNDGKIEIVIGSQTGVSKIYALNPTPSGERIYWQPIAGNPSFRRQKNLENIDPDLDMLSTHSEALVGTDPDYSDYDDDGLIDGLELAYSTDPTNPDTDFDGVYDGAEI